MTAISSSGCRWNWRAGRHSLACLFSLPALSPGSRLQELMAGGTLKALLVDAYYSTSSTRLFSRTVRAGFRV